MTQPTCYVLCECMGLIGKGLGLIVVMGQTTIWAFATSAPMMVGSAWAWVVTVEPPS
jgi:hypothetical protein